MHQFLMAKRKNIPFIIPSINYQIMKHFMFILTLTLLASTASQAQNSDVQAIHATIEAFAQAGDDNNADRLAEVLDDN